MRQPEPSHCVFAVDSARTAVVRSTAPARQSGTRCQPGRWI